MERITRDQMGMAMAVIASLRSTCKRKQVGAVIVRDGRVLSIGYAGAPSGFPHCSDAVCDLSTPCERTVHAEANAIAFAAKEGIAVHGASIYTTCSPCINCAKLLINSGIKKVYYLEEYRDTAPLTLLQEAHILVSSMVMPPELLKD
jgi:dCMP deaminase